MSKRSLIWILRGVDMKLGVVSILMSLRLYSNEVIRKISKDRQRMRYELNPEALQCSEVGECRPAKKNNGSYPWEWQKLGDCVLKDKETQISKERRWSTGSNAPDMPSQIRTEKWLLVFNIIAIIINLTKRSLALE